MLVLFDKYRLVFSQDYTFFFFLVCPSGIPDVPGSQKNCRYVVVDLSAGPCTFGKIETEEGTVNSRTLPRLQNVLFPSPSASGESSHDIFVGKLASVIATIVEHVIAPDVRYATYALFIRVQGYMYMLLIRKSFFQLISFSLRYSLLYLSPLHQSPGLYVYVIDQQKFLSIDFVCTEI